MIITRHTLCKTESPSTNTELKERIYASASPVFDVICAQTQTSGRGRLGRTFFSPPGGAYFSAAYPLTGSEKNIPFFTLLAGLAVTRSVKELTGVQTLIKWPNDVYFSGKKLCGILTELVTAKSGLHAIAGIGINVNMTEEDIPAQLKEKITSFCASGLPCPDKQTLICRTVEILDDLIYESDFLNASPEKIIGELNEKSFLFGKTVVYNGKSCVAGRIAADGGMTVRFGGTEETIYSGEIIF